MLADTTRSTNDAILLPAEVLWQALLSCAPTPCTVTDATKYQEVVWIFLFTHPPLTPVFVAVVLAHFEQSHSTSFGKGFKHLVVEGEKITVSFFSKPSNKNSRSPGSAIPSPISDIRWISCFGRLR